MKTGILLLILGTVTACASDPTPTSANAKVAQTDDGKGTICTYEKPVGSFLKEKRCTTAAERELARQQQGVLMDTRNQRDSGIQ